jgi:hypothetical protein
VWGVVTRTALGWGFGRRSGEVPFPPMLASTWQHRTPLGQRSGWPAMRVRAVFGGPTPGCRFQEPSSSRHVVNLDPFVVVP